MEAQRSWKEPSRIGELRGREGASMEGFEDKDGELVLDLVTGRKLWLQLFLNVKGGLCQCLCQSHESWLSCGAPPLCAEHPRWSLCSITR